MKFFQSAFNNKTVLITGHTGFKGSWLSLWLKRMGANVIGYALAPATEPALFSALGIADKVTSVIGDVCDEDALQETVKKYRPDVVFHAAAQALVRTSYQEPKHTYEVNVIGTMNVYEAVRRSKQPCTIVTVTSDKCYENKEWVHGYRENDPFGGYDPYSSSKGCAEILTASYRRSYFDPSAYGSAHRVALASVRAGNVIGGGDWALDRLIPDCVRSLQAGAAIELRNPSATRPWQHVLEPLSGYLHVAALLMQDPEKYCEGWNFGPNDDSVVSVENVVKKMIAAWGSGSYRVTGASHMHEAKLLKLDISKARFLLGWEPVYSLDEAISASAEWYRAYYGNNADMASFTATQIESYVNRARELGIAWAQER